MIVRKSENEKIQIFLDEVLRANPEKYGFFTEIREIILDTFPKTDEKIMYGGIVFFFNDVMFSGLFINKNHVTLEFSKGFLMKDPGSRLEGKGKYRKHLKITKREDVLSKEVAYFVKQAI